MEINLDDGFFPFCDEEFLVKRFSLMTSRLSLSRMKKSHETRSRHVHHQDNYQASIVKVKMQTGFMIKMMKKEKERRDGRGKRGQQRDQREH